MAREIIYKTLAGYVEKDGSPAKWYLDDKENDLIASIIELEEQSRTHKNCEYFIHMLGLSYTIVTVSNILSMMGYDIQNQPNKKNMRVHDMRYRINDKYAFFIQVKTGARSYLTFQAVEPVIGLSGMPDNIDDMHDTLTLYSYTRKTFLDGLKNSQTRILYSASTISRTLFNRQNKRFDYMARRYASGEIEFRGKKVRKNVAIELFCRPCVHGGLNFVSPLGYKYQGNGIVFDCNSLYSDRATHCRLPGTRLIEYGTGTPHDPLICNRKLFYMIQRVEVTATLKSNGIPCIQPDGRRSALSGDYIAHMKKRILTLTQADRDMLFENYDILYYRILEYMVFDTKTNDFKKYLNYYYGKKKKSTGTERAFAKLMQNGLIGTFAKQVYKDETTLIYDDDGNVCTERRELSGEEYTKNLFKVSGLCYINSAIVSEARLKMVRLIKAHQNRFLYTDTDSLHLAGSDIPDDIDMSDEMGAFKIEHTFDKICYKSIKNYIMLEDSNIILTCAGIPKDSLQRLYDGDKLTAVDYRAIQKCILSHDLQGLYKQPIPIQKLHENPETGILQYKKELSMLSGLKDELEEVLRVDKKSNLWDHQYTWWEDLKDNVKFWDHFNEEYGRSAMTPFNSYTEEHEFIKFVASGKWQNTQNVLEN